MRFDNGVTQLDFDPTEYLLTVEDRTQIHRARDGSVISATNGGLAPRRLRQATLRLTAAELAQFRSFFDGLTGSFLFTDTNGRVWTVFWLEDFAATEDDYSSVGHHLLRVHLLLTGVSSDAGTGAYSNVDAGQMSIQKSGGAILYFPLAYVPGLDDAGICTDHKSLAPGFLSFDDARYLARKEKSLRFVHLPDAFLTVLEDYYVATLSGAANAMSLAHFRDGALSCRWTGGMSFTQDDAMLWSGAFRVAEEV